MPTIEDQVELLTTLARQSAEAQRATNEALADLRSEMRAGFADIRREFRREIAGIDTKLGLLSDEARVHTAQLERLTAYVIRDELR